MSSLADESLDALLARLAAGDRAAFTPVFQLLWGPIERLCSKLLHNEADAADAAQEAMQKILERASDYDPQRPALPWALALATWECRTIARKRFRRRETSTDTLESAHVPVRSLFDDTLEDELVQRDLARAAQDVLGTLSELDREALLETFWDRAESGGATLRKRKQRALDRLRSTFRRVYGLD